MAAGAAAGERAPFRRWQRWLLLAGFALLVAGRLPHAWAHGRFLDEEATVFFAYAWHHPWADALFRPFAGYWNVGATATTLLAATLVKHGIVPLERAPYLTMTMALAVQLVPAALVLGGHAAWLGTRKAVVGALLVIAMAPSTEEVFLNVLHIQFHLALATGLLLALDPPRRGPARAACGLILFAAPLCGPGAAVMLPLFAARGIVDRDRRRFGQLGMLAAGTAMQMLLFYGANPMRGHVLDPGTIAAVMFVRLLALPAISYGKANRIGEAIYASQQAGGTGWWWAAAAAAIAFGLLVAVAARRRDAAIWLVLSGLAMAVASFGFGMVMIDRIDLFGVGAGERYAFLPLVFLGLGLIVLAGRPGFGGRPVILVLLLMLLVTALTRYGRPLLELSRGPSWPAEVAAWRRDHRHPLAVWPAPWRADLSDETRPCPPISADAARAADPRYCESGWVAGFLHPPVPRHAPGDVGPR